MGCYAQLKPKEIAQIEGVDLILGNNEKFKLKKYLEKLEKRKTAKIIRKKSNELDSFKSSFSFGNRTRSFLKVQDGCNYKCTFCTIPLARGKSRSNNIENVIRQIIKLKEDGIKEKSDKKRSEVRTLAFEETKLLNFYNVAGIRFNNIATNDAMVKSKLNEMSAQGWELVFVSSGVESADKERDAIFITRYHFRKEK